MLLKITKIPSAATIANKIFLKKIQNLGFFFVFMFFTTSFVLFFCDLILSCGQILDNEPEKYSNLSLKAYSTLLPR